MRGTEFIDEGKLSLLIQLAEGYAQIETDVSNTRREIIGSGLNIITKADHDQSVEMAIMLNESLIDTPQAKLERAIEELTDDEYFEVCALSWLGRGESNSLDDLRAHARKLGRDGTQYLVGSHLETTLPEALDRLSSI